MISPYAAAAPTTVFDAVEMRSVPALLLSCWNPPKFLISLDSEKFSPFPYLMIGERRIAGELNGASGRYDFAVEMADIAVLIPGTGLREKEGEKDRFLLFPVTWVIYFAFGDNGSHYLLTDQNLNHRATAQRIEDVDGQHYRITFLLDPEQVDRLVE